MVVCSCNVLTTDKIRQFLKFRDPFKERRPSVGTVIRGIGVSIDNVCGTCSSTIKREIDTYYGAEQ